MARDFINEARRSLATNQKAMKTIRRQNLLLAAALVGALAFATTGARAEDINTRIGTLSFTHDFANGYPTKQTVEKLYDERDFQRACQAYLWALPMVSLGEVEHVFMLPPGAAYGNLMRMETFPEISRFLTGNATTPYAMTWLNLAKSGPYVIEVPAGPTAGFVDDLWQRAVTDIGLPGPDKGQGAKYLVLGPGQTAPAEAQGYIVVHSSTFNGLFLFRLLSPNPQDNEALFKKFRLYPFSQRANPPANKDMRPDAGGRALGNAPRGFTYWEKARPLGQRRAGAGTRPHHDGDAPLARH